MVVVSQVRNSEGDNRRTLAHAEEVEYLPKKLETEEEYKEVEEKFPKKLREPEMLT